MVHLTSRSQLVRWLADNTRISAIQRAINRGKVTHHGLFKGGWVVSATYGGQTWIVGIRQVGIPPRLISGLLSRVPTEDYIGGKSELERGDVER